MLSDRDKVGEGVLLLQQLAVLVPQPAHLTTAAHMCDDEHHAAVQQRQPRDGKAWILADLVGAIAVNQSRGRKFDTGAVNDRNRDFGAVGRPRPVTTFDVVLAAVIAPPRLLAQPRALAG